VSDLNRREMLAAALVFVPVCTRAQWQDGAQIMAGADCLSEESAAGYRAVLGGTPRVVVLTGVSQKYVAAFASRIRSGATLIYELPPGFEDDADELYARFTWPHRALVRTFGTSPCSGAEWGTTIASCGSLPVAWQKPVGRGRVITLATLLGPHLLAGDREARQWLAATIAVRS
jgi:hypothetical protein